MNFYISIIIIIVFMLIVYPVIRIIITRIIFDVKLRHFSIEGCYLKGNPFKLFQNHTGYPDFILITQKGVFVIKVFSLLRKKSIVTINNDNIWQRTWIVPLLGYMSFNRKIKGCNEIVSSAGMMKASLQSLDFDVPCIPVVVFCPNCFDLKVKYQDSPVTLRNGQSFLGIHFCSMKKAFFIFTQEYSDVLIPEQIKAVNEKIKEIKNIYV